MWKNYEGASAWKTPTLAAILALSTVLTGCSQDNNPGDKASPSTTGMANHPAEIKWMQYPAMVEEGSYGQKYMEDKFQVKLTGYPQTWEESVQKQQLSIAGGDIPDVIFIKDPSTLFKFASQGLLAEVTLPDIQKNMPKTKAAMDSFAPQAWAYTRFQGKNYGLPTFYWTGQFTAKQLWRQDLLEKAGVTKVPETIGEFTQTFAALKKIGVYGMSTGGNSWYNTFHSVFGAYGVMPMQWMVKDGRVVNGATQPEAKEALAQLAEWYKAGYIDPDFITGADLLPKFIAGKYALNDSASIAWVDEANPSSPVSSIKQSHPDGKVIFGPPPTGPRGQQGAWAWGGGGNIWAFGKQLEKDPEKLSKILAMIETLQNDEQTFVDLAFGAQGKHWEYEDASLKFEGGMRTLSPYEDKAKKHAEGLSEYYATTLWGAQPVPDLYRKFVNKQQLANYQMYNFPVFDLFGKPDVLPSAGKYWADLQKLKVETYARIIMGEKPLSSFEDFVKKWNEAGGEVLEQEANDLYKQIKK
ncbi:MULTISPECIES: type 2 periplasmic-binding domain-containing protein [Paenibacillus]|uniref:extracellular solute-binding protein n=1 Tax=Paenibacillus TaxID=44249 RepID=UPI0022B8E31F|nr:extracellular solute-binding protein [Paenibacillus caseinilyticus]MCZ8518229.1 extracellular solute-binding protein [Paenibacillus caseinilyticus]